MEFPTAIQPYAEEPLPRQILLDLLKDYKRPNDKLHELVSQGMLTRVKRDIYVPGPKLPVAPPEPFLLANHLSGPSYISFETAMSYWGLIPERVNEISSATTGLSRTFTTPAGRFTYRHLPLPYYSFGIRQVKLTTRQTALVASPEKALCDKVIITPGILLRSTRQALEWLTEDMRIERQSLLNLDKAVIQQWLEAAPKKASLAILAKTMNYL